MLELRALGARRHAGQRLEALVDLQGIGGDRHRAARRARAAARRRRRRGRSCRRRSARRSRSTEGSEAATGPEYRGREWACASAAGCPPHATRASARSRRRRQAARGARGPTRRPGLRLRLRRAHRGARGHARGRARGAAHRRSSSAAVPAAWSAVAPRSRAGPRSRCGPRRSASGRAEAFHARRHHEGPDALAVGGPRRLDDVTPSSCSRPLLVPDGPVLQELSRARPASPS